MWRMSWPVRTDRETTITVVVLLSMASLFVGYSFYALRTKETKSQIGNKCSAATTLLGSLDLLLVMVLHDSSDETTIGLLMALAMLLFGSSYMMFWISAYWRHFMMQSEHTKRFFKRLTLKAVFDDANLHQKFLDFLKLEHNEENLLFVDLTRLYSRQSSRTKRAAIAYEIMTKFVYVNAAHQVNLSHSIRSELEKAFPIGRPITDTTLDVFDQAHHECLLLIQRDSFIRFKKMLVSESFFMKQGQRRELSWLLRRGAPVALSLVLPLAFAVVLFPDEAGGLLHLCQLLLVLPSIVAIRIWVTRGKRDVLGFRKQQLCYIGSLMVGALFSAVSPEKQLLFSCLGLLMAACSTGPISLMNFHVSRINRYLDSTLSRREPFLAQRPQTLVDFEQWLASAFSVSYLHFLLDVDQLRNSALTPGSGHSVKGSPSPKDTRRRSLGTMPPASPAVEFGAMDACYLIYKAYIVPNTPTTIDVPRHIADPIHQAFTQVSKTGSVDLTVFDHAYSHVRVKLQGLWEEHVVQMALAKVNRTPGPLQLASMGRSRYSYAPFKGREDELSVRNLSATSHTSGTTCDDPPKATCIPKGTDIEAPPLNLPDSSTTKPSRQSRSAKVAVAAPPPSGLLTPGKRLSATTPEPGGDVQSNVDSILASSLPNRKRLVPLSGSTKMGPALRPVPPLSPNGRLSVPTSLGASESPNEQLSDPKAVSATTPGAGGSEPSSRRTSADELKNIPFTSSVSGDPDATSKDDSKEEEEDIVEEGGGDESASSDDEPAPPVPFNAGPTIYGTGPDASVVGNLDGKKVQYSSDPLSVNLQSPVNPVVAAAKRATE